MLHANMSDALVASSPYVAAMSRWNGFALGRPTPDRVLASVASALEHSRRPFHVSATSKLSRPAPRRIALLAADSDAIADGIRDYTSQLLSALQRCDDVDAKLFTRDQRAFATGFTAVQDGGWDCTAADAAIVQYNPFCYGQWGFAPGLLTTLGRLRRASSRTTIALMVHENYIDPSNWKWALMSAWQRIQLRALQRLCDVQFCSIETYAEDLRRAAPHTAAYHLPVGSNFPDRRSARVQMRAALGIGDDDIVLCAFGMHRSAPMAELMLTAAREVGRRQPGVTFLNLGAWEPIHDGFASGVRLISPGFLEPEQAAQMLSAADIFLAAFDDGVSTRRTTLMASLQHQIAVVGTLGRLTDSVLSRASDAMVLTPVGEPRLFVEAVLSLASDSHRRGTVGLEGRRLYERHFDWPVVANELLRALAES